MQGNIVVITKCLKDKKIYWLSDNKIICNSYHICLKHLMKSVTVNETITSNFKYRKTIQISAQRKIDKFSDYKGQLVELYN